MVRASPRQRISVKKAKATHPRFIIQKTSCSKLISGWEAPTLPPGVVNRIRIHPLAAQKIPATSNITQRQIGHKRSDFRHRSMNRISDAESFIGSLENAPDQ